MTAQDGHTLPEALVGLALLIVIGSALAGLLVRASAVAHLHAQQMEHQQRARVALDTIARDVRMAGAGADLVPSGDRLPLPALWPSRVLAPDGPSTTRPHVLATLTVAGSTAQSQLAVAAAPGAALFNLSPAAHCPVSRPACGFAQGQVVAVSAQPASGLLARVTAISGATLVVTSLASTGALLPVGAAVAEVSLRAYEWHPVDRVLRLYDGTAAGQPFIDDVTGFDVQFTGTAGDIPLAALQDPAGRLLVRGVRITLTIGDDVQRVRATTAVSIRAAEGAGGHP
jgi:type II secretory pathway pseudopilin PulG